MGPFTNMDLLKSQHGEVSTLSLSLSIYIYICLYYNVGKGYYKKGVSNFMLQFAGNVITYLYASIEDNPC